MAISNGKAISSLVIGLTGCIPDCSSTEVTHARTQSDSFCRGVVLTKLTCMSSFPWGSGGKTTFSPADSDLWRRHGVRGCFNASIAQCYVGWYCGVPGGAERAYAHEVWDIQKNKYIHQDVLQTTLGSGSLVVAIPIRCLAILPWIKHKLFSRNAATLNCKKKQVSHK